MQARIPFGMTNIARTMGTDALFSEWKINGEIDHFDEGWGMGAPHQGGKWYKSTKQQLFIASAMLKPW